MSGELQTITTGQALSIETLSALILGGDLSRLSPAQKVEYYTQFCTRLGLDPATYPFKILKLNGKELIYAGREATAQLNKVHKVSHKIVSREKTDELYMVIANASTPDGRQTESIGAVSIMGAKGEALANAMMKAETKSKRRSTLDLLGLGMLDESESDSIPGAVQAPLIETQQIEQPKQELPPIDEKDRTNRRKWRATVNNKGKECKTLEDISAAVKMYEETLKAFFDAYTYHNETETYRSLLAVHADRIQDELNRKSPEGIAAWIANMKKATTFKDFSAFARVYFANEYLQTDEVLAALEDVASEFETPNWRELVGQA